MGFRFCYRISGTFDRFNCEVSASTRAMKNEIKLLNEKLDYLTDGSRRLQGLYNKRGEQIQNLQNRFETCENQRRHRT